jgi:Organic solute transporter Ostalpha
MGSDDEDERQSLLRGNRRRKKEEDGSSKCGVLVNRILIFFLLIPFAVASVYFQSQLTTVKETVHELEITVANHQKVIQRFNESVSNADVVNRMKSFEAILNSTTRDLQLNMLKLQQNVDDQLQSTLKDLGDTVQEAKDEISRQVDIVKKDVEQYVITTQDQFSMENSFMVYQLAGTFTLLSCLISMWHMTAHLRKMQEPVVQRKILAM